MPVLMRARNGWLRRWFGLRIGMHCPGSEAFQQFAALNGMGRYDSIDVLCADIAEVMKRHGDEFASEEALQIMLTEAGIELDEHNLNLALGQMEVRAG